jgi:hypothetical protein
LAVALLDAQRKDSGQRQKTQRAKPEVGARGNVGDIQPGLGAGAVIDGIADIGTVDTTILVEVIKVGNGSVVFGADTMVDGVADSNTS